jgi:cytochrome b subunit of formate dehydrogenase
VCPSLVLLATVRRHWHIHLYNVRQAWVWRFDDIKWLTLMGPAALSKRIVLPDQGKFNAAEKLNFMMVMLLPPLFIASGVLIWFPDSTALGSFFPWIVHFGLVALATPLVLGHVIMATINPSTRVGLTGMLSGFVSREWAAHHYARWFREQFPHLEHEHAGESTHDADVVTQAGACTKLGSQRETAAVVDQLPLETIEEQSPLPAVGAPLDDAALRESIVRAPTSPSNPVFAQAHAALASLQAHPQPMGRTGPLADVAIDAVAGTYKPGFVVDETENAALPAGNDA